MNKQDNAIQRTVELLVDQHSNEVASRVRTKLTESLEDVNPEMRYVLHCLGIDIDKLELDEIFPNEYMDEYTSTMRQTLLESITEYGI